MSTGLSYPDKAERARRDPHVALSFSDPAGTGNGSSPTVLVQGLATVRDADLQVGADRYVRESLEKTTGMDGTPWFLLRRMGWYFSRIWVEVTPERITWWPGGDLSATPVTWAADPPVLGPPSDPAPTGKRMPSRLHPPADWRPFAERAEALGPPVVTMTDGTHPVPVRTRAVRRTAEGFEVTLPVGVAGVERALKDWSLVGTRRQRVKAMLGPGRELKRRVVVEAARRGQPVPKARRPG